MRFLTDEEYEKYWDELGGVRGAIAEEIAEDHATCALDVGCGYGYFTLEIARRLKTGAVVAIDLIPSAFTIMEGIIGEKATPASIEPLMADAATLPIRDGTIDLAASFLGMRDIYMTTGADGVRATIEEMARATKTRGRITLGVTPPDRASHEAARIAIEVEGNVFGAVSPPSTLYTEIYASKEISMLSDDVHRTGAKLTAEQAETELRDGIPIAREIYGMAVPDFEEVWERYGPGIEEHGYGMYSEITILLGEKS